METYITKATVVATDMKTGEVTITEVPCEVTIWPNGKKKWEDEQTKKNSDET